MRRWLAAVCAVLLAAAPALAARNANKLSNQDFATDATGWYLLACSEAESVARDSTTQALLVHDNSGGNMTNCQVFQTITGVAHNTAYQWRLTAKETNAGADFVFRAFRNDSPFTLCYAATTPAVTTTWQEFVVRLTTTNDSTNCGTGNTYRMQLLFDGSDNTGSADDYYVDDIWFCQDTCIGQAVIYTGDADRFWIDGRPAWGWGGKAERERQSWAMLRDHADPGLLRKVTYG